MIKDPQAKLDYVFDWSDFLEAGETIVTKTVVVTSGDVVVGASEIQGEVVRAWIDGGTEDSLATVTCSIVTSAGREQDLELNLQIHNPVDYTAIATRIVRSMTGNRWTWPPMQVRDLFNVPPNTCFLQLRAEPVIEVVSVEDYATGEAIDFTRMGSNRIELLDNRCAARRRVDVIYNYGSRPSAIAQRAIQVLASEMYKSDCDDDGCRLPERVTTVNRQGVSWTLIDPMDFIDKGRTGIIEIDMAINAVRTRAKARPRVWSPEFPVPDRLSATELPYPAGV